MTARAIVPAPDPIPWVGGCLAGLARWAAGSFGDSAALELENGEEFTFRELATRVAGSAHQLTELGVQRGDRVAVAVDNRSEMPMLIMGASYVGASVLPVNPNFVDSELRAIFELVEPTHLIGLVQFCESNRELIKDLGIQVSPVDDDLPWTAHRFTPRDEPFEDLASPNHLDLKVRFGLTSGSTGVPKAVVKSQRQWLLDGRAMRTAMGLDASDRVMTSQPLYYGDPFMTLLAGLQSGATTVYLSKFKSQTFMENVAVRNITKFLTIGSMPAMLLNAEPKATDHAHLARGAWSVAIPRTLHAALQDRFGVRWFELYGSSEAGGVLAQTPDDDSSVGDGWLGRELPGQTVRLTDEDGVEIAGDATGMLEVRGPTVVSEYWRQPDASDGVFLPEGWYRTGDIMERKAGRYRYLYRQKDIVRRAGENISCQEVEAALREHPDVIDVAVKARPDAIRGEEVWAFVLMEGADMQGANDETELRARAEEMTGTAARSLSRHKLPRFYSFVDALPRTPTERVAKRQLPDLHEVPSTDLGERRASRARL